MYERVLHKVFLPRCRACKKNVECHCVDSVQVVGFPLDYVCCALIRRRNFVVTGRQQKHSRLDRTTKKIRERQ